MAISLTQQRNQGTRQSNAFRLPSASIQLRHHVSRLYYLWALQFRGSLPKKCADITQIIILNLTHEELNKLSILAYSGPQGSHLGHKWDPHKVVDIICF